MSVKILLIQPWRYKTLTVIKGHKTTYLYLLQPNLSSTTRLMSVPFTVLPYCKSYNDETARPIMLRCLLQVVHFLLMKPNAWKMDVNKHTELWRKQHKFARVHEDQVGQWAVMAYSCTLLVLEYYSRRIFEYSYSRLSIFVLEGLKYTSTLFNQFSYAHVRSFCFRRFSRQLACETKILLTTDKINPLIATADGYQ